MSTDTNVAPVTPPAAPPAPPAEKTLTQTEVNAIAAREHEKGKAAAAEELATQLGVPLAEAKELIAAAKAKAESEKSDAQKAKDAADAEKAAAAKVKQEAADEKHGTLLERALIAAGVTGDEAADEKRRAKIAKLVDIQVGADYTAIKAAVAEAKKDFPELFGVEDETVEGEAQGKAGKAKKTVKGTGGASPAPNGDPGGKPPAKKGEESAYERGQRLAKEIGNRGRPYPNSEKT